MGATGSSADLGVGLHIRTADSGASVNASHDELVIEGSGNSGLSILSGTSSNGAICFGDSGNNCIGYVNYDHTNNKIDFGTNGSTRISITSAGDITASTAKIDMSSADLHLYTTTSGHTGLRFAEGYVGPTDNAGTTYPSANLRPV